MAEEDQDQKTELPTGKRLGEARDRGQLPISREMALWIALAGVYIVVNWLAPGMARQLILIMRVFIEAPHAFVVDDHGMQTIVFDSVVQVAMATGLIFLVMMFAIIGGYMSQTGFFASTDLITPDFTKISLVGGLKRLLSMSAVAELGKSIGKLIILGVAVFFTLWPMMQGLPAFIDRPLLESIAYLHDKAAHLILIMLIIYLAVALGDLVYQRYSYIKSLKMTKTEVKDEFRQQEGDPIIKSRLRQIRMDKARKRMMAQVPKADVVITNPTHYAVALKYDTGKMTAPMVIAKGIDQVALRIKELAEDNKISLVSNPPLARSLYDTVEIDQEIPTQHYRAVAEIISYVYKLKKKVM